MRGTLKCRVCGVKFEMKINALQREVNVFCYWKDMLEEQDELERLGRSLGFQREDTNVPSKNAEEGKHEEIPGLNKHSKKISKKPKMILKHEVDSEDSESH